MMEPRRLLRSLFDAAVNAARAEERLIAALPPPPAGRTRVVGAGKAAAAMARTIEMHWPLPLRGIVVTRYGHGVPTERIEVIEAGHPNPDRLGEAAAHRIITEARALAADDLLICLISGGASALLALPATGLTLADKQAVTTALLRSGAPIADINCLRKHLSAIKGGRLAVAASPAAVVTLAVSDVPGDDPAVIGSGPTVADPTTIADALAVLARWHIAPPAAVARHLASAGDETPKPGDPRLDTARTVIIAAARDALDAAAARARACGLTPLILGDAIEGESREVAAAHAALALAIAHGEGPLRPPAVLLSGGETTVTVRGGGRGGRNTEYALALALALGGAPQIFALAGDSDGIDGVEDAAGAVVGPDTLSRGYALGLDAGSHLADNDSYPYFAALGDLIVTGPTRTNVNDIRAILILPPP
ncbi:MAG: glycerate kinase [Rhodospirillales bacterium]|nr:glycerate kinase [Rhodospirillales bacterium]